MTESKTMEIPVMGGTAIEMDGNAMGPFVRFPFDSDAAQVVDESGEVVGTVEGNAAKVLFTIMAGMAGAQVTDWPLPPDPEAARD